MSDLFWLTDEQMERCDRSFRRATAGRASMIDATYLKAHRTASSLRLKRRSCRLIGRTKGGMNTKLHAIADANGRPLSFFMTAARSAITQARPRCSTICRKRSGCSAIAAMTPTVQRCFERQGIEPCTRSQVAQRAGQIRQARYRRRSRIEIMFGRLKDWRRVATRYDRCPNPLLRRRSRCHRHLLAVINES